MLSLPLGPNGNQLSIGINPAITLTSYKNKSTNNFYPAGESKTKRDYVTGCSLNANIGYDMNFYPAGDWLKFDMYPSISYTFESRPYFKSETETTSSGTSTTVNRKKSNLSNIVTASLAAGLEFRPEKWVIGFMLGSELIARFQNTTTVNNNGNLEQAPAEPTTQTVQNAWITGVTGNIGVYIPLPENFRLDVAVFSGDNLFNFGDLVIQLVVPLK